MSWFSLAPAVPEIYLAGAICILLLVEVFAGERHRGLTPTLTLLALAVGAGLTVEYGHVTDMSRSAPCCSIVCTWPMSSASR